jgi:putative hydrolase of HD superfamily
MENEVTALLTFIRNAERLKTTYRHSWTSDIKRQESVADHSWMLSLLALVLPSLISVNVDAFRVLKMVVIHDLAESATGDIPAFEKSERQTNKYQNERNSLEDLVKEMPTRVANEILQLWEECEQKETNEAKLAQAIDKAEVLIQHNISDISTWDNGDYELGVYYRDDYFDFDQFIRVLKNEINKANWQKLSDAGTLDRLPSAQVARGRKEFEG